MAKQTKSSAISTDRDKFTARLGSRDYVVRFVTRRQLRTAGCGDCDGVCSMPSSKQPEIWIYKSLTGEKLLRVLLHEALHAEDWSKSEEWVDDVSRRIAKYLVRAGVRS